MEKTTKEGCTLDLEGEAEKIVWEGIENVLTNKYWKNMKNA